MVVEGCICCLVLTPVISYTSPFPMLTKVLAKRCQPTQAGHADSCMLHTLTGLNASLLIVLHTLSGVWHQSVICLYHRQTSAKGSTEPRVIHV